MVYTASHQLQQVMDGQSSGNHIYRQHSVHEDLKRSSHPHHPSMMVEAPYSSSYIYDGGGGETSAASNAAATSLMMLGLNASNSGGRNGGGGELHHASAPSPRSASSASVIPNHHIHHSQEQPSYQQNQIQGREDSGNTNNSGMTKSSSSVIRRTGSQGSVISTASSGSSFVAPPNRAAGTSTTGDGRMMMDKDLLLPPPLQPQRKRVRLSSEERLQRSRERNRVHARKTRKRKKVQMESIQNTIETLSEEGRRMRLAVMEWYTANILLVMRGPESSESSTDNGLLSKYMDVQAFLERTQDGGEVNKDQLNDGTGEDDDKASTNGGGSVLLPPGSSTDGETRDDMSIGDGDEADEGKVAAWRGGRCKYAPEDRERIRRERNRIHAKRTRDRRKKFMEESEKVLAKLMNQNEELRRMLDLIYGPAPPLGVTPGSTSNAAAAAAAAVATASSSSISSSRLPPLPMLKKEGSQDHDAMVREGRVRPANAGTPRPGALWGRSSPATSSASSHLPPQYYRGGSRLHDDDDDDEDDDDEEDDEEDESEYGESEDLVRKGSIASTVSSMRPSSDMMEENLEMKVEPIMLRAGGRR